MAFAALVCLLAAVLVLVRLHVAPTGLRPAIDAVSDYGTTPFHLLYRAQAVLVGVAAILVAAGLASGTDATGLGWLYAFGVCRIAISVFMTDRPRSPASTQGRIHAALAVAAFTTIAVATTTVQWTAEPPILAQLGLVVAVAAIATAVTALVRPLQPVFGLAERALYAAFLAWLLITAAGQL